MCYHPSVEKKTFLRISSAGLTIFQNMLNKEIYKRGHAQTRCVSCVELHELFEFPSVELQLCNIG